MSWRKEHLHDIPEYKRISERRFNDLKNSDAATGEGTPMERSAGWID
jgi:hypothetical protein